MNFAPFVFPEIPSNSDLWGNRLSITYYAPTKCEFGNTYNHIFTTDSMFYIHTDHLSSYCALTDIYGTVVQRNSFDPWGNYAFEQMYICSTTHPRGDTLLELSFPITRRGFTGHEHYPQFKIINMNGRLYDPVISRFFSPDKYVVNSSFTQDFNRYSYCRNNPLMYTDPDGEFIWIPIVIGAAFGMMQGALTAHANGAKGGEWAGYILGGGVIGALSGLVGAAIAPASIGLAGMASGAISGAGFAGLASKGDPMAMLNGTWKGGLSGLAGGWVSAAVGGTGGAFLGGAASSSISVALNGGKGKDILLSALFGGASAVGTYRIGSAIGWATGGNKLGDVNVSYRQYLTMQADYHRSRFWHKEYGGYLLEGGGVQRAYTDNRHNTQVDLGPRPANAIAEYHTHWMRPGLTRTVDANGDFTTANRLARITPAGQQAEMWTITTSQYHGEWDFNTGALPSYVINRYDASFFSGSGTSSSPMNTYISRFFLFNNWLWW